MKTLDFGNILSATYENVQTSTDVHVVNYKI